MDLKEFERLWFCLLHVFNKIVPYGKEFLVDEDPDWADREFAIVRFGEHPLAEWPLGLNGNGGIVGGNYVNADAYRKYAEEKFKRLLQANRVLDHVAAFESRNPEKDQWGGGVVFPTSLNNRQVIVTSGLPEEGDDVLLLLSLEIWRPHDRAIADRVQEVLSRTNNMYYDRLRDVVFG